MPKSKAFSIDFIGVFFFFFLVTGATIGFLAIWILSGADCIFVIRCRGVLLLDLLLCKIEFL